MSETNTLDYSKERQFLRYASITVKNFKKEEKVFLGNDFEIEFEWFKTIDQTQEDDSGTVTIYGLSDETIALLEEEGGEVWLNCGYEQSYIGTLLIAYASRVYTEVVNNITATTIECSANLLTHFFSGYAVSDIETEIPLLQLLENIGTNLGHGQTVFEYDAVVDDIVEDVAEFVTTYKTTSYNIGSISTILEEVTDYYGLNFRVGLVEDVESAIFSFTDLGLIRALNKILSGYPAVYATDDKFDYISTFKKTLYSSENLNQGFVLTKETGLIDSQAEYQIVTSFLHQKLNANEVETAESFYKRNNTEVEEEPEGYQNQVSNSGYLNSGDSFVSNSVLSGLTIKGGVGGQATQGGKVKGYTADFARIVSDVLGDDLIRFTGFNDAFHMNKASRHNQGQAFDLTIKSSYKGAPKQKQAILNAANQYGYSVTVLDEYNFPSSGATGAHLHVSVTGRKDANNSTSSESSIGSSETSKPKGDPYGRTPIEINRRYNRITALLNPAVKPQSLIFTKDKGSNDYLVHRVRHATYKGNNKRGEWTMTLYCEDTETGRVSGVNVETTPQSDDVVAKINLGE